jgi:DNA mismatch repair protein MutL
MVSTSVKPDRSRGGECTKLAAMHSSPLISPIRILPAQLADQIAAGEVIERPASVLKELIENALDAGSTRVDIELSRGGMESIRITDDGHGIPGSELPLAISRHATSKISRLDDLLQLQSLGFRGEALASICSVSQWEITSCRLGEESAFAMRYDQGQNLLPVNHAVGTSVLIRKLFFNTPARRKFLRAERTEFRHCDEVFRRMALARFDVAFYLKHNSRQVHRLPAVDDDIGRSRRVSQLCGEAFVRNSLVIDFPRSDMRLWGWISKPEFSRQQSDLQFFYINGRIIRDRVVNHAMRLAYQAFLAPGRHAAFVLHLELDPAIVDVNVHPTKHEVRFREARLIHDFLIRCLRESLQQSFPSANAQASDAINETQATYSFRPVHTLNESGFAQGGRISPESFFGSVQAVLLTRFVLTQSSSGLYLLDVSRAQAMLSCRHWQQAYEAGEIKNRPVLIPQRSQLTTQQVRNYEQQQDLLARLGFDVTQTSPGQLLLRAVPVWLQGFDSQALLLSLIDSDIRNQSVFATIEQNLLSQQLDIAGIDFKYFLGTLAQQRDSLTACWREMTQADLFAWLREQQTQHE